MSGNAKSILFALITAVVCSLILTGAATGLKSFKDRNVTVDRQKNILKAVGLLTEGRDYSPEDIEALYQKKIRSGSADATGRIFWEAMGDEALLPLYLHMEEDAITSYIIPVNTRGLWGKINGYLAIQNDGATIAGFSVYNHQETPGLGGEIEKRWFQDNFKGRRIVDAAGNFAPLAIAKGKAKPVVEIKTGNNFVDGISGATLTGKFLSRGLEEVLTSYEPLGKQFRDGKVALPQ
jgi:Na+-transporting NADH:ubiquinone oxidoreductase subunit C